MQNNVSVESEPKPKQDTKIVEKERVITILFLLWMGGWKRCCLAQAAKEMHLCGNKVYLVFSGKFY